MLETQKHIDMLNLMLCILRERKSGILLSMTQKRKCEEGIIALEKAVQALEVQVYA